MARSHLEDLQGQFPPAEVVAANMVFYRKEEKGLDLKMNEDCRVKKSNFLNFLCFKKYTMF